MSEGSGGEGDDGKGIPSFSMSPLPIARSSPFFEKDNENINRKILGSSLL